MIPCVKHTVGALARMIKFRDLANNLMVRYQHSAPERVRNESNHTEHSGGCERTFGQALLYLLGQVCLQDTHWHMG